MDRKPTAIDLFSGCGGVTTGLTQAGFDVLGAVEIDRKAIATYRLNHPAIKIYSEDIRLLSPDQIMAELKLQRGDLDLLAGCPPCQSFSRLSKKNKTRAVIDPRNSLIEEFLRFAISFYPKKIMMENVPGLATHYRFKAMLSELKKHGYRVFWKVLDVQDYGVPQRRKRLIVSASRCSDPAIADINASKVSVRQAISGLPNPGSSGDTLHDLGERRSPKVLEIIKNIPLDGGSRKDLPCHLKLGCHQRSSGFSDVYGRMSWDKPAPTITSGCHNPSKGRFLHPSEDRTITLREAAVLQGFPADYKFDVSHGKESIALMIGNALPPPFIMMHALCMKESLVWSAS